ncbi:hypothetical protein E2C01_007369 [Portunus trituberculatus]|uniref:Uncharacterized protein n=1 Tax=Portunus trituberculatus TaxID=210409 RepID=A0A5B7D0B6_PORTR|nr:hypothetical protein [Portunus trituberculatus]
MLNNDFEIQPTNEDSKTQKNPKQRATKNIDIDADVTIPILDDLITVQEVEHHIQKMKEEKVSEPDDWSQSGKSSVYRPHVSVRQPVGRSELAEGRDHGNTPPRAASPHDNAHSEEGCARQRG